MTTATNELHPFFAGMKPEHVAAIRALSVPLELRAGTVLLREGEPAHEMFLVVSGEISIEVHTPGSTDVHIYSAGAGEVLGWSWLFAPYVTHLQAKTTAPTKVLRVDGAGLLVRCEANRDLGYEVTRRLAEVLIDRLQAVRRETAHLLQANGPGHPAAAPDAV